jgi:elongation factor Ts
MIEMTITATQVKELREKTGVGMMECKKALEENSGNMEKAILWLRERGMSRAAKKADRVAAEGIVEVYVNDDQNAAAVVELNCETDFVSKNDDFRKLAHECALLALKNNLTSADDLLAAKLPTGATVKHTLTEMIAKIGENMNVRRCTVVKAPNGLIAGYTHMGGKIGTLVALEGGTKNEALTTLGKDIAMHVAAAAPRYMASTEVDKGELEQERDLARKKLIEEKKPEAMIEKILEGQMKKFFKEVCLVDQAFVKDPDMNVATLVQKQGGGAKLVKFVRYHLGEGIEKKSTDFAAEVAAQLKQ